MMPVPTVGRTAALDESRRAWEVVDVGGISGAAIITRPAGTGKSTLITAVLAGGRHGRACRTPRLFPPGRPRTRGRIVT
jgi:hypothetical protein